MHINYATESYVWRRGHDMLNQQFLDVHKERQEVLAMISDESLKLWELSLHLQTILHETNSLVH